MADATYKSSKSAVIQELIRRANGVLGYPKIGKVANGATNVGGGVHVPDDQVITAALTEVSVDTANGNTFLHVTDAFRVTLDAEKAAAAARIAALQAISFDVEIVALAEEAVAFGDLAQPVFNPRQIPNCKYWQRADTGIVQLANSISEWTVYTDTIPALSSQAVALNKPTWVANDFNGRASVSFDGGDFLHFVAGAFAQASTLYIVAKPADQVGSKTILTTGDDGMRFRFEGANIEGFAGQTISVGPIGATTNIFEFVVSGSQSRVGVNNTGPDPVIMGGNTGTGGIRTGADNAGATGLVGVVFEMIYYTRVLTPEERLVVRKGLGYQYGIQVL